MTQRDVGFKTFKGNSLLMIGSQPVCFLSYSLVFNIIIIKLDRVFDQKVKRTKWNPLIELTKLVVQIIVFSMFRIGLMNNEEFD